MSVGIRVVAWVALFEGLYHLGLFFGAIGGFYGWFP